jgi:hypothetical protein
LAQLDSGREHFQTQRIDTQIMSHDHTSNQMLVEDFQGKLASNSEPDMPLSIHKEINAVRSQAMYEDYVPWIGAADFGMGILPKVYGFVPLLLALLVVGISIIAGYLCRAPPTKYVQSHQGRKVSINLIYGDISQFLHSSTSHTPGFVDLKNSVE